MGDPFAEFMLPPSNESPSQTAERLRHEKSVSDEIDEAIKAEKRRRKEQEKNIVRVLLLGQSESGKSTTLKNFRMAYAKEEWSRERASWKAVIQLNLIRNVLTILDAMEDDERAAGELPAAHKILKLRLAPLRHVETDLKRFLGAAANEISAEEIRIGAYAWQDIVNARSQLPTASSKATEVISSCRQDMSTLRDDAEVQAMMKRRDIDLANGAGFFLDDIDRIASPQYEPSDDDIVKARLRTMGIQEYGVKFDKGMSNPLTADFGKHWVLYDVGGSRTVRHTWIPYFDNVNAIIFLAPISCFDETLLEDPSINRLADSLSLFKLISTSKLLSYKTSMVVFLNKCDLLQRKIRAGKKVEGYDGPEGDVKAVIRWMRDRFRAIAKEGPSQRTIYLYPTQVTDTKATATTLQTVRDSILRDYLKQVGLM